MKTLEDIDKLGYLKTRLVMVVVMVKVMQT